MAAQLDLRLVAHWERVLDLHSGTSMVESSVDETDIEEADLKVG
jgi:hypothetical protein